jgi:glycosyltransferase involved in cell wall biosynthesis
LFFPKNRDYQQQKNKELLYVGRISPEKGLHVLLEAFQKVAQQQPNVNLKILGGKAIVPAQFLVRLDNNPEVKALIRFYQQSQDYLEYLYSQITPALAKKISFIGALSQIELVDYYRQADLLINPALSEAFGMSLIEAMATGIPVIGAKIGGMNNVISEGEVGLFFKSAEPDSLATAILKLLDDDCTRKTMGLAGRQRVLSLFSWERVSENLWDYYQNLLESE